MNKKIAILGGGRIGEALLSGLLSSGWREASEIVITNRGAERVAELHERYGVDATADNAAAIAGAGIIVVAVKPQDIDALLADIGVRLTPEQTVVSVAAAIPTAYIEERIADGVPVVRAMPNAPATVHEGMAGICAGSHAGDDQLALASSPKADELRRDHGRRGRRGGRSARRGTARRAGARRRWRRPHRRLGSAPRVRDGGRARAGLEPGRAVVGRRALRVAGRRA